MSINLEKINLRKEQVINLKKEAGIGTRAQAQVVLAIDYSGSMSSLYSNGTVQDTVERILSFGLAFDDNGEVDVYRFEDGSKKIQEPVTLNNLDGYVNSKIHTGGMGGTKYAPVLNAIQSDFKAKKSGGFLGMGGTEQPMDYPVYVIFVTDGDNSDRTDTERVIREMSQKGYFIQFIGIGNSRFDFLDRLDNLDGRKVDNANFFKVSDIKSMSDDSLYRGLMTEYPEWYKQVKTLGLIK